MPPPVEATDSTAAAKVGGRPCFFIIGIVMEPVTATLAADAQVIINNKIKNKLLLYLWQDVQGSSSLNTSAKLFAREIRSFDDLYSKYGNDKVFSDSFVEEFLRPNRLKYPY